jgi:hypothetical protein
MKKAKTKQYLLMGLTGQETVTLVGYFELPNEPFNLQPWSILNGY